MLHSHSVFRAIGSRRLQSVGFLLGVLMAGVAAPASAQEPYVRRFAPLADSLGAEFGIPRDLILAVAVIESGSGTSRAARLLHNHFGIVGRNSLHATHGLRSRYKQYSEAAASYVDFCTLLSRRPYYARLRGSDDIPAWIAAVAAAGYSEDAAVWKRRVGQAIGYVQRQRGPS